MKRFVDRINCLYSNHLNEIMIIGFIMFMIPAIISNTPMFKENQSVIDSVARVLLALTRWSSLGLMATKVLIDVIHKQTDPSLCLGLGMLSLITIITTRELDVTKLFLLVLFMKDFKLREFMCLNIIVQSLFVLFILYSVSFGVIDNALLDKARLRFSMGFDWVTYLPILFFFITSMLAIYLDRSYSNIEFILLLIVNALLYIFTNTRMTFIFSLIIIIFGKIKNFDFISKLRCNSIVEKIIIFLPFILLFQAILLSYLYSPSVSFWKPIDVLMSGRLGLMNKAIHGYGISLFGQDIQWIGYGLGATKGAYNFVDNSYLKLFLDYGIVVTFIVLGMYSIILKESLQREEDSLLVITTLILFFCFFEPYLIQLSFNVIPILVGILITPFKINGIKEIVHNLKSKC